MHYEKWSNYYVSRLLVLVNEGLSPQLIAVDIPFTPVEILQKAYQLGYTYLHDQKLWILED